MTPSVRVRMLLDGVPADHPVPRVLAEDPALLGTSTDVVDEEQLALRLLTAALGDSRNLDEFGGDPAARGVSHSPGQPPEPPERADDPHVEVATRLLAVPAVSAQDLTANGLDPADTRLRRLTDFDGGWRYPDFQFDQDGRAMPVVQVVNTILDATADPWGVADWWLGVNAWLGAIPAELVGRVPEQVLLSAARAVEEED